MRQSVPNGNRVVLVLVVVIVTASVAVSIFAMRPISLAEDGVSFHDVESQTRQFFEYEKGIQLTAVQEAVKKEALIAIPAPCCSDNTAYTCCCPCNLARSIWGLSNHLIAKEGADVATVRAKVQEWVAFVNPDGYSGDVCYVNGGCNRPFHQNGCGGMSPEQLSL